MKINFDESKCSTNLEFIERRAKALNTEAWPNLPASPILEKFTLPEIPGYWWGGSHENVYQPLVLGKRYWWFFLKNAESCCPTCGHKKEEPRIFLKFRIALEKSIEEAAADIVYNFAECSNGVDPKTVIPAPAGDIYTCFTGELEEKTLVMMLRRNVFIVGHVETNSDHEYDSSKPVIDIMPIMKILDDAIVKQLAEIKG